MKQIMLTVAAVTAVGLASPAFAQQGQTGGQPPQPATEPAAAQATGEQPPSPEETLADHRNSFFARIQERKAEKDAAVDVESQQEIRYHRAW